MEKKINLSKMLCAIAILMAGSLSAHANGVNESVYNTANTPRMDAYTIELDADVEEGTEEFTYNVVLNWISSLDMASGENVPQTYTVYIVDEYGYNELAVTDQTTFIYTVPQYEHSYTLTYIVCGQYSDGEQDLVTWSNTDAVIIPGWNDFLALYLDHYESDYVRDVELNYYRNFLTLSNLDEVNGLTTDDVNNGENIFTLYRFDCDCPEVLIPVAQLWLNNYYNGVKYTIDYLPENQQYRPNYSIDLVTQGILPVNNGVIDFSSLTLVDQFAADVSENQHPNRYGYVLMLYDNEKSTNIVEVPVMKVDATIDGFYTQQEVMADIDAALIPGVKNANVEMYLQNLPEIYYYELERGNNCIPQDIISRLQRRTDGTFMEMNYSLPDYGMVVEPGFINRYDNNAVTGEFGEFMSYLPTVWTFCMERVDHHENSYGGPILKTGVALVEASVNGVVDLSTSWMDENGEKCAIFNPIMSIATEMPDYASVEYEPYMFRVWRKCNSIRNYTLDPYGHRVNDTEAPRENFTLIAEVMGHDTHIQLGSEEGEELAFGATVDSKDDGISFLVRFYYKKVNATRDNADDKPMYYVVEDEVAWNNIVVAITPGDVNGDGYITVSDVTLLIDYLLSGNSNYYDPMADVNCDGVISVADVTALIDMLLSGN